LKLDVDSVGLVDVLLVIVGAPRPEVVDLLAQVDQQCEALLSQASSQQLFGFALFVLKIWSAIIFQLSK
jgi:hypothetical protein